MNAYHVTLEAGNHSKTLLVITPDFGSAQKQAEDAMEVWNFKYWRAKEIKLVARNSPYGDGLVLVEPLTVTGGKL